MIDKLFNVAEVAKILKVSERQVWRYVKSKKLKSLKLSPGVLRFTEKDIDNFLKHK
jgi:excisionase family DNA binding protein